MRVTHRQVYKDGYHGDTSATYYVGRQPANCETQRLMSIAKNCRDEAISICGPHVPYRNIGRTIRFGHTLAIRWAYIGQSLVI